MKDYSEYIDRFDLLEELPVSEEMIGAYLEGNLSEQEAVYVSELIEESPLLYEVAADGDLTDAYDVDASSDGYTFDPIADGGAEVDFPREDFDALQLPDLTGDPYIRSNWEPDMENFIPDNDIPVDIVVVDPPAAMPYSSEPAMYPEPMGANLEDWEMVGIWSADDGVPEETGVVDGVDSSDADLYADDDYSSLSDVDPDYIDVI